MQFGNQRGPETLSVDQLNLTWDGKSLMALIDRRLAVATEGKFTSLGQMVDAECFRAFAEDELHLSTPRDWLNLAQMVGEQVATTSHAPLSEEEWKQVRRAYFAAHIPIYFDKVNGVFVRGEREVLSQKQRALFKLLKHFYDNPGFHKIYKVEAALDISTTNLHTYINRIREVIEPSPNHEPVYLVFDHKQQAYALQHAIHANTY
ncbi:MAG: hypothetical protein HC853_01900 [Anaerolineae bacterium]|nr:hypothetical protein [Anaerolineae bacterium]